MCKIEFNDFKEVYTNMKKIISLLIVATMLLSFNIGVSAEVISGDDSVQLITNSDGFITTDWSNVKYISVDEYLNKYGGENKVNNAFNQAEKKHKAMLLKSEGKQEEAAFLLNESRITTNEENDLLLSIKEGCFLGLEIESISDLPPDNTNLSIRLKREQSSNIGVVDYNEINEVSSLNNIKSVNATHQDYHSDGSSYNILYTSEYPNSTYINNYVYEDFSGSYFYKYGYSWTGDYRCTSEVTFNNTQLYCGTQNVNMYVFIGAMTGASAVGGFHHIDFGFMANPKDNTRNQGLYAVRNIDGGSVFDVEAYPKVLLKENSGTNPMVLENKTVKLQLTIDTLGNVETVMYVNNSMIYYKTQKITGFVSGSGNSLTFFQAMSCVDPNEVYTDPSSGSYFKNVNFANTKLYNDAGERAFGTYGNNTYYVYICKPEDISYSYGTNSETVSIVYD